MSILHPEFSSDSQNNAGVAEEHSPRIEPHFGSGATSKGDGGTKEVKAMSTEKKPTSEKLAAVFDFGSARKRRIDEEVDRLKTERRALIRAGMETTLNMKRVERTILGLASAWTTEALLTEFSQKVAVNMAVDYTSLCLESETGRLTNFKAPGVYWLTPGSLDAAMHGERLIMSSNGEDYARVFGSEAFKIHSCALVRLEMPEIRTRGVLAFGAKTQNYFNQEQGTDLISFLGAMSEKLLTRSFMTGFADEQ